MSSTVKWGLIAAGSVLAISVGVWFFFFRGSKTETKVEKKAA